MMHLVLVSAFPRAEQAREQLPGGCDKAAYLGVRQAPQPYDAVVHVFCNEATRAGLERAGGTWEDA